MHYTTRLSLTITPHDDTADLIDEVMSRQYICSGKAVEAVLNGRSFKSYCASTKLGKVDYALACETLKTFHVLKDMFDRVNLDPVTADVNQGILYVMTFELFFGKRKISSGGAVKRKLMEFKDQLNFALESMMREQDVDDRQDLIIPPKELPSYVRINELKIKKRDGMHIIQQHNRDASFDKLIPSLVMLPPKSPSLGEHVSVKTGQLIIQDKASCFPSQVLADSWKGGDIIDATAAPGNKTSHMASEIFQKTNYNKQKIFAFDKDKSRAKLLKDRMENAAATSFVNTQNTDFLSVDVTHSDYKSVNSILCDPSCSGNITLWMM